MGSGAAICVVTVRRAGGRYERSGGTALTLMLYVVNGASSSMVKACVSSDRIDV